MRRYSSDEVSTGNAPYAPWRFIGEELVAPFQVTPGHSQLVACRTDIDSELRDRVLKHINAVLISSRAINKMMDKPELFGYSVEGV